MILYIIRHGEPDYQKDELTEKGRQQAEYAANRLAFSGVDEIHASPMGRAVKTAEPLANKLSLPIIIEPWAYELCSESDTDYPDGVLHTMSSLPATYFHGEHFRTLGIEESFDVIEGLQGAHFKQRYHDIANGLDEMLNKLGYVRNEHGFYDIVKPSNKHIALFCHCAMQRVLISHLYHLPYQFLASSLYPHFTGITTLYFSDEIEKKEIVPLLLTYGDVGHYYHQGEQVIHSLNPRITY